MNSVAESFASLVAPIAVDFLKKESAMSPERAVQTAALMGHVDDWFRKKAVMPGFGSSMTILTLLPDQGSLTFAQVFGSEQKKGQTLIAQTMQVAMDILARSLGEIGQDYSPRIFIEDGKAWLEELK